MKYSMTRIGMAGMWLLRFVPDVWLWRLGQALGGLLYKVAGRRRRIALRNLACCFPEMTQEEREALALRHFRSLACAFLDFSRLWWADEATLRARHTLHGADRYEALMASGQPIVVLGYHCVGIEAAGARLAIDYRMTAFYMEQSNKVMDERMVRARTRFVQPLLIKKGDSARKMVQAIRSGAPAYYLPDMDFGARDSVFVPFFGVPAATLTGLARIVRLAGAVVMPCVTFQRQDGSGYDTTLGEPWRDYPSGDDAVDARRMNAWLEEVVRQAPEQYYWVHKRFKTRPPGEASIYD
jgi:KDO2-lipid IV(A) lauroyltransferase